MPWIGAVTLVLAGFGAEMTDGAGNLLFLRAVHPYERISYRDVAQLGPPVVSAVLLYTPSAMRLRPTQTLPLAHDRAASLLSNMITAVTSARQVWAYATGSSSPIR